jgi:hypothetical protein
LVARIAVLRGENIGAVSRCGSAESARFLQRGFPATGSLFFLIAPPLFGEPQPMVWRQKCSNPSTNWFASTVFNELEEDLFKLSDSLEAFNDLERCTDRSIMAQRSSERIEIRVKTIVRPANLSSRHQVSVESVTADISSGGCMVLASRAILPGDLYHLTFHDALRNVNPLLARCMRCRMIQDDAFEVGFRFLQNIPLKDLIS